MARTVRIAYSNLIQGSGVTIVPSSESTSLPRAALTRQGLGDVWRSQTGWTVVSNENDKIDFSRGGVLAATVAAGTYATGAALAAAIVTALEAADPTPVWACDYNVTAANKFTISTAAHNFQLLFASGANIARSIATDAGFGEADTALALTATGDQVTYQSRQSINVDLGSAGTFTTVALAGHNFTNATLQADVATMIGVGLADVSTPDFSQGLSVSSDPFIRFVSSTSKRYLRLLISNMTATAGYTELAIWFVGPYSQPSTPESWTWSKNYEQLSETYISVGGANVQARRGRRRVYSLQWRTNSSADVTIFEDLDSAMPAGSNFFISFDAVDNPTTSTVYGFLRQGLVEQRNDGALYVMPLEFAEVLE